MKVMNVKVTPISNSKSKTVAFASAQLELEAGTNLILRNLTVVDAGKGLFLGFPQHKIPAKGDRAEKWDDTYALSGPGKDLLSKAVIEEFKAKAPAAV
jgi:DNA-binding cell septation regulator SpoVG